MTRRIATGIVDFVTLRQKNYFYIDKTRFIEDWWNKGDFVTLITRPRRFGKTLLLNTIKTFFSPEFSAKKNLFEGLEIFKSCEFRNLQGTIPVIFLSFARINNNNYAATVARIKAEIAGIYGEFSSLIDINAIPDAEKELFTSVRKSMSDDTAQDALSCKISNDSE